MPNLEIARERLLRQRITGEGLKTPADVVHWMGAVQAQDFAAAKWAVGLRTRECSEAEVEEALTEGRILRTHVMRPTWHFVAPDDIRWLQALTAPRVNALNAYQYRRLELDATLFKRSNAALEKALRGGRQLTRAELGSMLAKAGIAAKGLRLAYLVGRAELDAIICSGARRGKQFTYALVDERAPRARTLRRDDALAELTQRYFTSHGPATVQDFAWWSGLSTTDVTAGLEMVKPRLAAEVVGGKTYWLTTTAPAARPSPQTVHLLPNYDEYIVGYTDRDAIFNASHLLHLDARQNPLFMHSIVSDGRIIGTWKRTMGKAAVRVAPRTFIKSKRVEQKAILRAAQRFAKFSGLAVEIE